MRIRSMGETLTELADSLLHVNGDETFVRATSIELMLPIDVSVKRSAEGLVFCADVPAWRWRTDFDAPFSQLYVRLEEARQEIENDWI